jgi:hypothetical protein
MTQHTKERLKAARAAANQTRETLDRCAPRDPVVDETLERAWAAYERTCRLTAGEGEASC